MSALTGAVAVAVSEDSTVGVFDQGKLLREVYTRREPDPTFRASSLFVGAVSLGVIAAPGGGVE